MLQVINPATGSLLKEIPTDDSHSIQKKFCSAKKAQSDWNITPLEERLVILRRFRDLLQAKTQDLATILSSEVGKPIYQSRNELKGVIPRIDFFLEHTPKVMKNETVFKDPAQNLEETISFDPLGVIVNISAWNYPYFVGSNVFVPALLTGNAVLYKPSEYAPSTGLSIEALLSQAGLPPHVFTTLIGDGLIGTELLSLPTQGVFFTGSYATGKRIAEQVAGRMIKTQLELGGKDPIYVCNDVDIQNVAEAVADGAFYNTGQSCCSVERIYVHQAIYDGFVESFMNTVRSFQVGDPFDENTYIGPLTRSAHLRYLEHQVFDAKSKGAKLLCGGKKMNRPGFYFEPTVLTQVNHTMELMKEETFGPVIGIQKVSDDKEALRLMNDTQYGLTAGVYTRDQYRAQKILSQIHSGTVYWNCCDRVSPRLPWTGRGYSGMGSTLSHFGIQTFVQPKAWHLRTI